MCAFPSVPTTHLKPYRSESRHHRGQNPHPSFELLICVLSRCNNPSQLGKRLCFNKKTLLHSCVKDRGNEENIAMCRVHSVYMEVRGQPQVPFISLPCLRQGLSFTPVYTKVSAHTPLRILLSCGLNENGPIGSYV